MYLYILYMYMYVCGMYVHVMHVIPYSLKFWGVLISQFCQILLKNKFLQELFSWSSFQSCLVSIMNLKFHWRKFLWPCFNLENFRLYYMHFIDYMHTCKVTCTFNCMYRLYGLWMHVLHCGCVSWYETVMLKQLWSFISVSFYFPSRDCTVSTWQVSCGQCIHPVCKTNKPLG